MCVCVGGGMIELTQILSTSTSLNARLFVTPTETQILFYTRGWMRQSFQSNITRNNKHSFD
jgi:hypothetical protein